MTQEEFAETLGVARRTVATWHERPDVVLRPELQRALDTTYEAAPEPVRIRFARQVSVVNTAGTSTSVGVALTVAIAVVVIDSEVLVVCRRHPDPSGITWQFPAGIVKPGESASMVAVRETLAETGVHCTMRDSLGRRVHPLSRVTCDYFLCDYLAGAVMNRDITENVDAIWIPTRTVTRFIPPDRIFPPILRALEATRVTDQAAPRQPSIAAAIIVNDGLVLLVRRRVAEGELSWQFPAGEVEPGESDADAAVREAREEVGLTVRPTTRLGERTHPTTGRTMCYVACEVVAGTAHVADREELADVAWCDRTRLAEYVPSPLYAPVQEYLDANLTV